MKKLVLLLVLLTTAFFFSCSDDGTSPSKTDNFVPLEVGNYWEYKDVQGNLYRYEIVRRQSVTITQGTFQAYVVQANGVDMYYWLYDKGTLIEGYFDSQDIVIYPVNVKDGDVTQSGNSTIYWNDEVQIITEYGTYNTMQMELQYSESSKLQYLAKGFGIVRMIFKDESGVSTLDLRLVNSNV